MSSSEAEWTEIIAAEYCDSVRDGTHDSPKRAEHGKRLITSKHIKGGVINFDDAYLISEEDFAKINERSAVGVNDVLISMIGTIGEVCRVSSEPDFAIKNLGLFKVSDELKSKYLVYYLKSSNGRSYINSHKAGSTQEYISLSSLRSMPILVPCESGYMAKIVGILDSIDEKIRVSRRLNDYLAA